MMMYKSEQLKQPPILASAVYHKHVICERTRDHILAVLKKYFYDNLPHLFKIELVYQQNSRVNLKLTVVLSKGKLIRELRN